MKTLEPTNGRPEIPPLPAGESDATLAHRMGEGLGVRASGEGESSRRPDYQLRPVALNELEALAAAHEVDGHSCILPTRVMEKSGQVLGAVSLGAVCLVLPWFSTARCHPRDSLTFIRLVERHLMATLPASHPGLICVPFVPHSPFHKHVQRLGYRSAGLVDLTFKQLR